MGILTYTDLLKTNQHNGMPFTGFFAVAPVAFFPTSRNAFGKVPDTFARWWFQINCLLTPYFEKWAIFVERVETTSYFGFHLNLAGISC